MKKSMSLTILFFGALWGLLEATLGYVLQFLPPLVSGSIMFPIGATILMIVYLNTESKSSILWVGVIAATIKSVNFFMPGLLPIKTYNPMIAIMLQSVVMVAVAYVIDYQKVLISLGAIAAASLAWRMLFIINIMINNRLTGFNFPQLRSQAITIEFIVSYGLIGAGLAVFIFLGVMYLKKHVTLIFKPSLALSLSLFSIAVTFTYYIQSIS